MIATARKARKLDRQYERRKERARSDQASQSAVGRDIGRIPPIADPMRRARAAASLRVFTETYLLRMFTIRGVHWPWSQTHLDVMAWIERAVREKQKFVVAMPRAGGKTALIKAGVLWAFLNGYIRYVCVIAATAPKALNIMRSIRTILETNPTLKADYPEVCFPIAALERIVNRQGGQTCLGRATRLVWNADKIIAPDIPGSPAAQSVITCTGLDGAGIRGQVEDLPDGTSLRPELVLLDDPQTEESAKSDYQTGERMNLIDGAIADMAPPGMPLAGLAAVTVIRKGDLAEKLLALEEWHGVRSPMLVKFPVHRAATPREVPHNDLWDRYSEMLSSGDAAKATELYAAHYCGNVKRWCPYLLDRRRPCGPCRFRDDCMDAEAIVSWKHRKYPGDLSAIQHAMNRHIRKPAPFAAEMQQEPLPDSAYSVLVTAEQVCQRVSGLRRGRVPPECLRITAYIDVHADILYFVIVAWQDDFSGQVIDYGTFPEQPSIWFKQASPPRPMRSAPEFAGMGLEGTISAGLERLATILLKREFERRAGGGVQHLSIERLLVDGRYKPGVIAGVIRMLRPAPIQMGIGSGIGAKNKPIAAFERKPGWRFGDHWYEPLVARTREFPHVTIDTNFWKSFVHNALAVAPGDPGALLLFGQPGRTADHEPFAEHIASSESFKEVYSAGNLVNEWKVLPHRPDNHWFDCLVGCAAAASMCGCRIKAEIMKVERSHKGRRAVEHVVESSFRAELG